MHYLIFGAGAVGSYLGTRLALSGQQITFLSRSSVATAWREKGLHLVSKTHEEILDAPYVIDQLGQILPNPQPDLILLTVKTYDVEFAAKQIQQFFPSSTPIVCFTNGVGSEELLSKILKSHLIIPATLTTAVQRSQDGVIYIERERGIGIASTSPIVPSLVRDFKMANLIVRMYPDAGRMKWSKLLVNIVSNASSAILGWSPRQIFQHQQLHRIEVEALRETVRVMRKMKLKPQNLPGVPVSLLSNGIFLPPWMTQGILGRIVATGRGDKLPSFHFDIGRGCSEIYLLNGSVVKAGEQIGLATPTNRFLLDTMTVLVENAAEHEALRNQPEELIKRAINAGVPGIRGYNP